MHSLFRQSICKLLLLSLLTCLASCGHAVLYGLTAQRDSEVISTEPICLYSDRQGSLNAFNMFLKDDLRAGMELLKDTHENAYKTLREASQVADEEEGGAVESG